MTNCNKKLPLRLWTLRLATGYTFGTTSRKSLRSLDLPQLKSVTSQPQSRFRVSTLTSAIHFRHTTKVKTSRRSLTARWGHFSLFIFYTACDRNNIFRLLGRCQAWRNRPHPWVLPHDHQGGWIIGNLLLPGCHGYQLQVCVRYYETRKKTLSN